MARPLTLTDANFRDVVLASPTPAMVLFWAQWNSTSKAIAPTIEQLATEYEGRVLVGKLEADSNPNVPALFGVSSVPQLLFFRNGQLVSRIVGYRPVDVLRAELDSLLQVGTEGATGAA
jgi:thioredoxin 1